MGEEIFEYGPVSFAVYYGEEGPVDRRRVQVTLRKMNGYTKDEDLFVYTSLPLSEMRIAIDRFLRYLEAHP